MVPSIDFRNASRFACSAAFSVAAMVVGAPAAGKCVQWEDRIQSLGLATVQIRRVIVDTEQRRRR